MVLGSGPCLGLDWANPPSVRYRHEQEQSLTDGLVSETLPVPLNRSFICLSQGSEACAQLAHFERAEPRSVPPCSSPGLGRQRPDRRGTGLGRRRANGPPDHRPPGDLPGRRGQRSGGFLSAGPANPKAGGRLRYTQDRYGAVLRPVSAAAVNFSHRPRALPEKQPHLCAETIGIAGRPDQPDSQPGPGGDIAK